MKQVHHQEKEQLKKLFAQENIDRFEDRFKIYEAFLKIESHVTANELFESVQQNGPDLSADFVRDTLHLMYRFGFAQKNQFDNGQIRYEHRHLKQHHDHMICTKCRNVIEFENPHIENMQIGIATAHGFHMLQHKMEIYGICARCQKERISLMPLSGAKQGETLVIEDFTGGAKARMRLLSMGLRIGDEIDVLTNMNQGQVVVAADFKRYVLGRGLTQKIQVRSTEKKSQPDQLRETKGQLIRLSEMKKGQTATIVRVGGSGPLRRRILEMGILAGTEIYVEKYAPLKDPLELIVKGYHISLRVEEAAHITVENIR